MRFPLFAIIGLTIIVVGGIVLVTNHDAKTILGLESGYFAQLVGLLALLILIGSGLRIRNRVELGQAAKAALFWTALLMALVLAYSFRHDASMLAGRLVSELAPGSWQAQQLSQEETSLRIRRNQSAGFVVHAELESAPVAFLFDTGASITTLTHEDAGRIGINTDKLVYGIKVLTANGSGYMAPAWIKRFIIGKFEARNVRVLVAAEGALLTSLLGTNIIRRFSSFEQRGDTLILHY